MGAIENRIKKLEEHSSPLQESDNWPKAHLAKDILPEETLIEAVEEAIRLDIPLECFSGEARNE